MAPPTVVARITPLFYLGEEVLNPNGAAADATLPDAGVGGALCVEIRPEDEECFYTINGTAAAATSGGYVAAGGGDFIGPVSNLDSISFFQVAGGLVHLLYWREDLE